MTGMSDVIYGQDERRPFCGCYTEGVDCSTENGYDWYTVYNNPKYKGLAPKKPIQEVE